LLGFRNIKIEQINEIMEDEFHTADNNLRQSRAKSNYLGARSRYIVEGWLIIIFVSILMIAQIENINLNIDIATLAAFGLAVQKMLPAASQLFSNWSSIRTSESIVIEIHNTIQKLENEKENLETSSKIEFDDLKIDRIKFDNIKYKYDSNFKKNKNISVNGTLNFGSVNLITGISGSGKSTLLDLISKLIEPKEGRILIDNVNLSEIDTINWRMNIAYCPQEPIILNKSLAWNLTGKNHLDPKDVENIKEVFSLLEISEFSEYLVDDYRRVLGEFGGKLSGGQRKRVSIAKTILTKRKLMLFDEPLAGLDSHNQALVLNMLKNLSKNYFVIIVEHNIQASEIAENLIRIG